jgi:hypothetical protein
MAALLASSSRTQIIKRFDGFARRLVVDFYGPLTGALSCYLFFNMAFRNQALGAAVTLDLNHPGF